MSISFHLNLCLRFRICLGIGYIYRTGSTFAPAIHGLPLVFDTPNGEIVSGKIVDLCISRISLHYFRLTGQ